MSSIFFPKSWYPLCRSSDLKRGQIKRIQAFGIPLAVYRAQDGTLGTLSATCPHMGADLSRGRIVNGQIQCPMHDWRFDRAGQCTGIPASSEVPDRANQLALACQEQYGIVFVFWGGKPSFELPSFNLRESMWTSAYVTAFDSPYQVLIANAYDGQHFGPVHGREFLEAPSLTSDTPNHFRIHFKARVTGARFSDYFTRALGMKNVEIKINCWGGNTLLIHNQGAQANIFVSILPEDEEHSRIFITTLTERPLNPLRLPLRRLVLGVAHQLTLAFLTPDIRILDGMKFNLTVLIPEIDQSFIQWVKYWKSLPREAVNG